MSNWQKLENECCDYLNTTYGSARVKFESTGGSDSNAPDIKVYIDGSNAFNIEVKSASAQSGQFVATARNGVFVFSEKNMSNIEDAEPFLYYMNNRFEEFSQVSTKSIYLEMDKNVFCNWIIKHYIEKNTRYVITQDGESFVVFPIEKYGKYFSPTASYRIKKSGSGNVPQKDKYEVMKLFNATSCKYDAKGHFFMRCDENVVLKSFKRLGDYDYYISKILESGEILVTRLSNTFNPNVIFSIKLIRNQELTDLIQFENSLR